MKQKTIMTLLGIGALAAGCASPWGTLKAGSGKEQSLLAVEGGATLTDRMKTYGFLESESTPDRDFESFYGEGRVTYDFFGPVKGIAEVDIGTGYDDTIRAGVALQPEFGEFTLIKVFPYETAGDKGPQVSVATSHRLGENISASLLVDYNLRPGTLYIEPQLTWRVGEQTSIFLQGRAFGEPRDLGNVTSYLGLQVDF